MATQKTPAYTPPTAEELPGLFKDSCRLVELLLARLLQLQLAGAVPAAARPPASPGVAAAEAAELAGEERLLAAIALAHTPASLVAAVRAQREAEASCCGAQEDAELVVRLQRWADGCWAGTDGWAGLRRALGSRRALERAASALRLAVPSSPTYSTLGVALLSPERLRYVESLRVKYGTPAALCAAAEKACACLSSSHRNISASDATLDAVRSWQVRWESSPAPPLQGWDVLAASCDLDELQALLAVPLEQRSA